MTEVTIVTLHVPDHPPVDAPAVFLGGVPVPAHAVRLEVVQPEPPGFGETTRWLPRQEVVLELRALPGKLANDELVNMVVKPAKPHSGSDPGYVDSDRRGGSVELDIDGCEKGEVTLTADNGDGATVFVTLHRDEILSFVAELIALQSRCIREHEQV